MGSFLFYFSVIVGCLLTFVAYVNSNPIQMILAWRWISIQILALIVYAGSGLSGGDLASYWVIQALSIILLVYTILLMAFAEAAWEGLLRKLFDLFTN